MQRRTFILAPPPALLGLARPGPRAGLPEQADPLHRAGVGRRRQRHGRPHRHRALGQAARPDLHRRQPERRRRRRRARRPRRARRARRLHADAGYVGTHGTNPAVRKLPYDAVKDFTPIAHDRRHAERAGRARRRCRSRTLQGVRRLRRRPTRASSATARPGPGSLTHLAMEQFKQSAADLDMVHVPYRGIAPGHHRPARRPDAGACSPAWPRRCRTSRPGKMRPLAVTGTSAPSAAAGRADVRGARATRASTACSGTASSARPACRPPIVKRAQRRAQRRCCKAPDLAREAVGRGARADADDAASSSAQYIRDDIARWTAARQGPQHPDRRLIPHDSSPWHATPRSRPTTTRRRSRASSPTSSPAIRRAAGATRSSARRIARFLNWVGCAIGAARHEAVEAALAAVQELAAGAAGHACSAARAVDMASAALLNGITLAHLRLRRHAPEDDHPSGRTGRVGRAGAGRAHRRERARADRRAGARHRRRVPRRQHDLSRPLRPRLAHHRLDRHARRGRRPARGCSGSTPARRRWRSASPRRSRSACASSSASMTKPFHPGGAARAGLMSALMARHGYTASPARARGAARPACRPYSTKCDWNEITDELGERFEISFNTYKPFACGIVIHPSIDGCVQLRDAHGVRAERHRAHRPQGAFAGARAHRQEGAARRPRGASSASTTRCAAGMLFGRAGEDEFADDDRRRAPMSSRCAIEVMRDGRRRHRRGRGRRDVACCSDGRRCTCFVEHAIGSLQRPMSDAELDAKFALVEPVLGRARTAELIAACRRLGELPDLAGLVAIARP